MHIPSEQIVRYVARHPIDWDNRERAKRGGVGDQAGVTPTPAVEEFLRLYLDRRDLFTQRDYMYHCWDQWRDWIVDKPKEQKLGVKAKLYRNFYPSMIDSLHVYAMLVEMDAFDTCVLNSSEDAIGKSDLILTSREREIRLALIGPKQAAVDDRAYKLAHRNEGTSELECIEVVLRDEYPMYPGNKRWYQKQDLWQAILAPAMRPKLVREESPMYLLRESNAAPLDIQVSVADSEPLPF